MKIFFSFSALSLLANAAFNILDGGGVYTSSGTLVNTNYWSDLNADTGSATDFSGVQYLDFRPPKLTRFKTVVVILKDGQTGTISIQVSVGVWSNWQLYTDLSLYDCGSPIAYDSIVDCNYMVGDMVRVTQPDRLSEVWAFIWPVYDQTVPTITVTSSTATLGHPATNALALDASLWSMNSGSYFETTGSGMFWQVQYPSMIFITYVLVFARRGYSLQNVTLKVLDPQYTTVCTDVANTPAASSVILKKCYASADKLLVESTASNLSLYYVAPLYVSDSCSNDLLAGCSSVTAFSAPTVITLTTVVMDNPPTLAQNDVYTNTCCPVIWAGDYGANQFTLAQIDRNSQGVLLKTNAKLVNAQKAQAFKFTFMYYDGTNARSSSLQSLQFLVKCHNPSYTIDNVVTTVAFTNDQGKIAMDYLPCMPTTTTSLTINCVPDASRPGYVTIQNYGIKMDFTKRVSTAYYDANYQFQCSATSNQDSTTSYTDVFDVGSIDCIQGLIMPNPALTLGTQTIDLSAASKKFTIQNTAGQTITVSAFSFQPLPQTVNKSCGGPTYSMTSTEAGFVTKISDLVFELHPSSLTNIGPTKTITFTLLVDSPQFTTPNSYSYEVQIYGCQLSSNQAYYELYYLHGSDPQITSQTTTIPVSYSATNTNDCLPFIFEYEYTPNVYGLPKPSFLEEIQTVPPKLKIWGATAANCGYVTVCRISSVSGFEVKVYIYMSQIKNNYDDNGNISTYDPAGGVFLNNVGGEAGHFTVYDWTTKLVAYTDVSIYFPIVMTMSHDNVNIPSGGTNVKGLDWRPSLDPKGNNLGWFVFGDKADIYGLQVGIHNMVLAGTSTYTTLQPGGTETRTVSREIPWQFEVIDCWDISNVKDPNPLFKTNTGESFSPPTIYFPRAVPTYLIFQDYRASTIGMGSTPCPYLFTSVTAQAQNSSGTLIANFVTVSGTANTDISFDQDAIASMLASSSSETVTITFNIKLQTTYQFTKTLVVQFVSCALPAPKQPDLSYCINLQVKSDYPVTQLSTAACDSPIKVRVAGDFPMQKPWVSLVEGATSIVTINSAQQLIAQTEQGKYDLMRYVEYSPGKKFDVQYFSFYMCHYVAPTNNGVASGQTLTFDKASTPSPATFSMESGSITPYPGCSLSYALPDLANWMAWDSQTMFGLKLTIPTSRGGDTPFTYRINFYQDANVSLSLSTFTITITILDVCNPTMPADWVSYNGIFATIFDQNIENSATYTLTASSTVGNNCGTKTFSYTGRTDSGEDWSSYLTNKSETSVVVIYSGPALTVARVALVVSITIQNSESTLVKSFTINMQNCSIQTGTVTPLADIQMEVGESRDFSMPVPVGYNNKCSVFQVYLAYYASLQWQQVQSANVPAYVTAVSNVGILDGEIPGLQFTLSFAASDKGIHVMNFTIKNGKNVVQSSTAFNVVVCQTTVSQAVISPSALDLTGQIFEFGRRAYLADPKITVEVSTQYSDPTLSACTYSGVTLYNVDGTCMTQTIGLNSIVIEVDSFPMDSDPFFVGYEIYRRDITVKVWHKIGEEVIFPNPNRFFTIIINNCFQNLQYPSPNWILETPAFDPLVHQFEEATGVRSLTIMTPTAKFPGYCGSVSYFLLFKASPSLAYSYVTALSTNGMISIATPADIFWGPEQITIRVENSFNYNESTFQIQVFDCKYVTITTNTQDPVSPMVSTGPDWSYTWKQFTTSFAPCVIDTYEVSCAEGAWNSSSGLCNRGFQVNPSPTTNKTAALRGVSINPLTILAQYEEIGQISVDHEGEFTLTIKGYSSANPLNFATHQILVSITTPCDNALNWIQTVTYTFVGSCRTDGTNTFCDAIHYTIFTTQDNPIIPYNYRFHYSCTPFYEVLITKNGLVSPAPAFIQLLDSALQVTTSNPAFLRLQSVSNDDRDYDGATLSIKVTVGAMTAETSYPLFVFNDCSPVKVPMTNTGQTLFATFTVSQHLMQNASYVNSMTFNPLVATNASDQKYCVVSPQDYSFKQLNQPPPQPPGVLGDFNSDLFSFNPGQISNQISLHATSNRQIESYLNGQTQCGLLEVNTDRCDISFEISATALLGNNGTYPLVASGTVAFMSECFLLKEYYDLRWSQQIDSWQPMQSTIDPYIIRDPLKTDKLPRLIPILPSIDPTLPTLETYSIKDLCGRFTYSMPGLASPFAFLQPLSWDTEPSITCYSDDPEDADQLGPDFSRFYTIDLQATFDRFTSLGAFSNNRSSKINYAIRDPCFGLKYTDAYINYDNGISPKVYNSTVLEVVQNSLWDAFLVTMPFQKYSTPEWDLLDRCGEVNYTAELNKTNKVLDWNGNSWVQGGAGQHSLVFKVFASKLGLTGVYEVTYQAYIVTDTLHKKAYLYPTQTSIVKVLIADCYISSFGPEIKAPSELIFYFYGPPKKFSFPDFKQTKECNYNVTYSMTAYELINGQVPDYKDNDLPDPNPIQFDKKQREISISTTDYSLVNRTYQFYITGKLDNPVTFQPTVSYKWGPFNAFIQESIFLILNTAPKMPNMLETYPIEAGLSQLVSIGSPFDIEGNQVSLEEWSLSDNTITWVVLASTVDLKNLKSLDFVITPPPDFGSLEFSISFILRDNHAKQPLEASFIAQFKVLADQSNFTFDGWEGEKQNKADQRAKFDPPPVGLPQAISNFGGFSFTFDQAINRAKLLDMQDWNSENQGKEYFEFELIPADQQYYDSHKDSYQFSWIISSANETNIDFQFQFADYTVFSQQGWDKVRFKLLKPEVFVSLLSNKGTEFTSSVQRIPSQVRSQAELVLLTKFKDNLDRALKTLSASSALNVLLSSSLQYLWGMINSMQIIVLTVLFNLRTPVNAQNIEVMILQMVSFDIIRTSSLLTKVFKFDNELTPPLNFIFEQAGYESSNFILGMGPLFIAEVGYLLFFICLPVMKYICSQENNKLAKWMREIIPFQILFRFYLEGTLELTLNTLITFRKMDGKFWTTWQLWLSNIWAAMNLIVLIVMPVLTLLITLKFHKSYHTDWTYRAKYDWMFEEIKGKHRSSALYHFFFIIRRYIITLCLVAMPSNTLFQIYLQVISSSIFFLYLIDTKPFTSPKQNRMELLNEFAISVSCYFLFLFTDLVLDNERRYSCGWALCLHLVISIVINFSVVVYESVTDLIRKIKVLWFKRKVKIHMMGRLRENHQANVSANERSNNQQQDSELDEEEQKREQERQIPRPFDYEGFMRRIGAYEDENANNRPIVHPPTVNELRQRGQLLDVSDGDVPIIRAAYPQLHEQAPAQEAKEELKEWVNPFSYEEFERNIRPKNNANVLVKHPNLEEAIKSLEPIDFGECQLVQSGSYEKPQVLEEVKQTMSSAPQTAKTSRWAVSDERAIELLKSLSNPDHLPEIPKQTSTPQPLKWAVSEKRALELLGNLYSSEEPKAIHKPLTKQESEYDLFGKQHPNSRRPIPNRTMGVSRMVTQPLKVVETQQNDGIERFIKELSSLPHSDFDDSSFFESSRKAKEAVEEAKREFQPDRPIPMPKLRISPYSVIKKVEAEKQQLSRDASTGRVREVLRDIRHTQLP